MSLSDWKPLPGSKGSKYYHIKTGETISRRQRDNIKFVAAGFSSRAEYERLGSARTDQGRKYRNMLRKVSYEKGIPLAEVRKLDSELHKLYGQARKAREEQKPGSKIRHPAGSPLAQFLEYIGVRQQGANYPVGETQLSRKQR